MSSFVSVGRLRGGVFVDLNISRVISLSGLGVPTLFYFWVLESTSLPFEFIVLTSIRGCVGMLSFFVICVVHLGGVARLFPFDVISCYYSI